MKKTLKFLGYTLLTLIGLLALAAFYVYQKGVPYYDYAPTPEIQALQVPRGDSAMIARGYKFAAVMCKACHRGSDGKLSGDVLADMPPMFGTIAAMNITRDSVHGIGAWTDGELYYFLRTGIRKNGSWAPPFMPKLKNMADEDIQSIIAWLRSNDPDLTPSSREYPPNQWNFTVKVLANTLFSAPPLPAANIPLPDTTQPVALGKYLANDVFECFACHSGDVLKVDDINPANSFGYYGGGSMLMTREREPIHSANLTPHPVNGIGNWTEQQFIDAVKFGKKPRGGALSYPMLHHTTLTDTEVKAIFAFLKTVPPLDHKVDRFEPKQ